MIKGYVNPINLDRIVNDLGGWEMMAEYREGVLIDFYMFHNGDSVIGLIEQYLNPNESIYRVEMAPEGSKEANKIERYFTMKWELDYTR